ncbi:MAG: hypothetical protein GKR99_11865 [Rhodobacteraceae bacterium]|nr:hypothetical protein [Paracoccaceae bacterium]
MKTNETPIYDQSHNTTGCCPKFNPEGWDDQKLHFEDKKFLRAVTKSAMHIPLNMSHVFGRVAEHMEDSAAMTTDDTFILSRDMSPWKAEHFFAVSKDVEGEEMVTLSGDFITRVFEGPYQKAKDWEREMRDAAKAQGKEAKEVYFMYTTCPSCSKAYGENYLVGVAHI